MRYLTAFAEFGKSMREYKGFKYGLSKCGDDIHYYTEKTIKTGKKQIKLKSTTIAAADKEVHKIIDNILKQKQ